MGFPNPQDPVTGDKVPAVAMHLIWILNGTTQSMTPCLSRIPRANPVFWRLHGWIDDRINDWFAAHEGFTQEK